MTQNNTITFDEDASGIGLVTFDQPGRAMNVLTPELLGGFATLLERLEKEDSLKGWSSPRASPPSSWAPTLTSSARSPR
jgi:enoyl-CoA hydratase/carnithine racemase